MTRTLPWQKPDPVKNYYPVPKFICQLGLSPGEIAVYSFLLFCEDRKTYQCYPSYRTIGDAVGMSRNTVCKYVRSLEEKGLIRTERTPSFSGMAASETAHCSTRCCHGDMRWSSSISDNWPWPKLPPNVNRYSSNWRSRKTRCMEVRPYDLATAACADRQ